MFFPFSSHHKVKNHKKLLNDNFSPKTNNIKLSFSLLRISPNVKTSNSSIRHASECETTPEQVQEESEPAAVSQETGGTTMQDKTHKHFFEGVLIGLAFIALISTLIFICHKKKCSIKQSKPSLY